MKRGGAFTYAHNEVNMRIVNNLPTQGIGDWGNMYNILTNMALGDSGPL